ncbi:GNAT family N-acetyltransferase/peptidase C39 family protein [Catenovulum agarivorans]|uniref:GNAT family N-acetyltransferase/peptidase C39 family protein n=1 Tax=Catenovulum agarivorans TaxID=1172192 RepID=UPI0002E8A8FE|nr:GNAT family N-acetyltransferase/peptidase C39 family protein [Catenovulum agarivorans]
MTTESTSQLSPTDAPIDGQNIRIERANLDDLKALVALENQAFEGDKLTKRRLKHWITAQNAIFIVAKHQQDILGYALTILHKGSALARLYSLAVSPLARGLGIAAKLIQKCEKSAFKQGRLYLRLEVAENNQAAISLYRKLGFEEFGFYQDYYHDHQAALRMQKRLYFAHDTIVEQDNSQQSIAVPWYQQTTPFTCGPAAAMMAMATLDNNYTPNQNDELHLWREATTIFMTSGHGGCHPVGLALALQKRQFNVKVFLNQSDTLFLDGVRSDEKRTIIELVEKDFKQRAVEQQIAVEYYGYQLQDLETWFNQGAMIILLISTYQLDGTKAPHWVCVSGIDNECVYIHDPDPTDEDDNQLNCQYMPIARDVFSRMNRYGKNKLSCAIVVERES